MNISTQAAISAYVTNGVAYAIDDGRRTCVCCADALRAALPDGRRRHALRADRAPAVRAGQRRLAVRMPVAVLQRRHGRSPPGIIAARNVRRSSSLSCRARICMPRPGASGSPTPAATRRSRCATSRRASASARPTASRYASSRAARCAGGWRRSAHVGRAQDRDPQRGRLVQRRSRVDLRARHERLRVGERRRRRSRRSAPGRADGAELRIGTPRTATVAAVEAPASRSCASKPAWMRAIRSRWPSAISPVSADQAARSSGVSPGAGAIAWPLSEPSTVQIASTSAIESVERAVAARRQRAGDGHLGVAVDDLGGTGQQRDLEPGALLAGCPAHAHPAARQPARERVRGLVPGVDLGDERRGRYRG